MFTLYYVGAFPENDLYFQAGSAAGGLRRMHDGGKLPGETGCDIYCDEVMHVTAG
jgi:hypothetical protein